MDLNKFIPEALQDPTSGVLSKMVSLFEQVLNGDFSEEAFSETLTELGKYWSAQKPEHLAKLRTLLDPLGISPLLTNQEDTLSHFMIVLQDLYASKGTDQMFRYILSLCGMDAEIIKWYQPEYLKYTNVVEHCSAILIVKVKDAGLSDGTAVMLEKLVAMLLDVCLVISSLVLVKLLEDKVDVFDNVLHIMMSSESQDSYSRCKFILSQMYDLREYRRSDTHCSYETEERFLTPLELLRYECTECNFVYDPVLQDRTPFLSHAQYTCLQCHSQDFIPIEYDPQDVFDTLKMTALLLGYAQDLNAATSSQPLWELVNNAWNDVSQVFVGKALSKEKARDFAYLFLSIERDGFRPLEDLGLSINEARSHEYRRGYITAPYGFHGDPFVVYDVLTHEEREDCPAYHDGHYRFQHPSALASQETDLITKMVHIKDPVLYHENHLGMTHNYEYRRGERFDLTRRLCYTCTGEDVSNYGPEGVYPYPRHLGDHGPREFGWWYWGVFGVFGGSDKRLIQIQNTIQEYGIDEETWTLIGNTAVGFLQLTSTQRETFFAALAEAVPFLTDSVYCEQYAEEIDETHISFGKDLLTYTTWVEDWQGDQSQQDYQTAVETKRSLLRIAEAKCNRLEVLPLLQTMLGLEGSLKNKPKKSYASTIPLTPRVCDKDPFHIQGTQETLETFGHFHIRHDGQAAHRYTEYDHNPSDGIYEDVDVAIHDHLSDVVAWDDLANFVNVQHTVSHCGFLMDASEALTSVFTQYMRDSFSMQQWTQLQHNAQLFHTPLDTLQGGLHMEPWDTGVPRGSDQFPSPVLHDGKTTHGEFRDHTFDADHTNQSVPLTRLSDPARPSNGEVFYIQINDDNLGLLHPLSDPIRWDMVREAYTQEGI